MYRILFLLLILVKFSSAQTQSVGLVLSGGGATGMAHIGVLKALEENNIPIDFITGTSAGALIGALYASGYTPSQIEEMVSAEEFKLMVEGKLEKAYTYYFKEPISTSSLISLRMSKNKLIHSSLPTNFITPSLMDFELMKKLAPAGAACDYNFDQLMIPFRCIASDITSKKTILFKDGNLNEAVRASMTFPFYLNPITVDGKLLFDGGLYNNFPSDVMYDEFLPDIIIGSNVTENFAPPTEDDLISQVSNMLVSRTNFTIPCEEGIIIHTKTDINTFDFQRVEEAIEVGYSSTIQKIDSIKSMVKPLVNKEEVVRKREVFNNQKKPLIFNSIFIDGIRLKQSIYIQKMLYLEPKGVSIENIKKRYFRILADDKINSIFPKAIEDSDTSFSLHLKIKKEREFKAEFGGNFSSKPINTGFVGLEYNYFGKTGLQLAVNSYFGKFYGSLNTRVRFDFAGKTPFYLEPEFLLNRWDFFKSRATFFEEVKPSFIILNEQFAGLNIGLPVQNRGKFIVDGKHGFLRNKYYQTEIFNISDTSDLTKFQMSSIGLKYERNTLNKKQFANSGNFFQLSTRYISGEESTIPGSTSILRDTLKKTHNWVTFKLIYDNYFKKRGILRMGAYFEAVYSTQSFFNNYTATILSSPSFEPTPQSRTIFIDEFRAHQYFASGLKADLKIKKNFNFRIEGFVFQPVRGIVKEVDFTTRYENTLFDNRYYIGSMSTIYHSPVGPLSLSLNYYDVQRKPWALVFNFGYLLFNKRATTN